MEVHKIHEMNVFREAMLSQCQKQFLQIKGQVNVIDEATLGKFTDCKGTTIIVHIWHFAKLPPKSST